MTPAELDKAIEQLLRELHVDVQRLWTALRGQSPGQPTGNPDQTPPGVSS